jgi:hypothetical protein
VVATGEEERGWIVLLKRKELYAAQVNPHHVEDAPDSV